MAIYRNQDTRILIQGITGSSAHSSKDHEGLWQCHCRRSSTRKGARRFTGPSVRPVAEAVEPANASYIRSCIGRARSSTLASDAGLRLVVVISEHACQRAWACSSTRGVAQSSSGPLPDC